jgi:hypothetical protein
MEIGMKNASEKATKSEPRFMSFRDEDAAENYCRRANANRTKDVLVIVEGPGENEWSVMPCRTATESGFLYRWVA